MIRLHSLDLSNDTLHLRTLPAQLSLFADQLTSLHCANQPLIDASVLGRLWSLRALYLERCELQSLPARLSFAYLYRLYVRHNRLTRLPAATFRLRFLRELYISHNALLELPDAIGELSLLEELDIQGNQLASLPRSIARLASLRLLRLDRNQLRALPDEIAEISTLQDLFVKSNQLTSLPPGITRLGALRRLYACFNQIAVPPANLCCLTSLQNCSFSNNALRALPSADSAPSHASHGAALPPSLKRLVLSHNSIRWLFETPIHTPLTGSSGSISSGSPLASPRHSTAAVAAIANNNAQRISLIHVQNLVQLDLTDNRLRSLTPSIGDLVNLRTLTMANNFLTALPDSLFKLTRLNVLDVAYNLLEDMSIELRRLSALASLHLNSNRLETLPDVFDQLPDLSVFLCDKNRLSELPPTLVHVHANANVNLEDNLLEPTLASLCFLGFSAVREYLLQPDEAKSASAAALRSSFEIDFSRIQLGAELGRGAFGIVHKATLQPDPPRRRYAPPLDPAPVTEPIVVAVKVLTLRVDQIATEAGRRRFVDDFRRELAMLAKTAQSWSFPASVRRHFVGFFGACTQDPFCLVTEYCARGSLHDTLARYRRGLHASVRYYVAIEVAEGLHNLHSHTPDAILHHDVKTSNILITQEFAIKLADFGLARVQASTRLAARLAADGNVLSSDDDDADGVDHDNDDDDGDEFESGIVAHDKMRDPLRDALFQSSTGSAFNDNFSGYDEDDLYDGRLGESAELDGYSGGSSTSHPYAQSGGSNAGGGGGTCFFVPYAAPEILRGGRYDIAAETYSFGVVLWTLAAGGEPFAGRSLSAIRQAKLSGKPLPLVGNGVDAAFSDLVARCTAHARESRPSFPTIIAELRSARDALGLQHVEFPEI